MAPLGPKNPSATFFWNDWDNDEALKACSLAAQGLWMRMLCIAARSPEQGVVMIGGFPAGRSEIAPRIAAVVGKPLDEVNALIDELLTSGAADVDRKGRIINRRMVKAAALHKKRSEAGEKGASVTNEKNKRKEGLPRQTAGKGAGPPSANEAANDPPSSSLPSSDLPSGTTNTGGSHEAAPASPNGANAPRSPRQGATESGGPEDVKTAIFSIGLTWLMKHTKVEESSCRSFLGMLIGQHGEIATATALLAAERAKPVDPRSWLKRNIGATNGQRPRNHSTQGELGGLSPELAGISAALARRSVQPG